MKYLPHETDCGVCHRMPIDAPSATHEENDGGVNCFCTYAADLIVAAHHVSPKRQ
jgi:hypothetical protein